MITKKPSFKATVSSIGEGVVQIELDNKTISLPEELFSKLPKVSEELYITLQTLEDYKEHHAHLSKSILNTIFKKTS